MSDKVLHKVPKRHAPFLTANGDAIFVKPFSPLLAQRVLSEMEALRPEPPTYTVESMGDVKVELPHTAETVSTPEEKAAFAKFTKEFAAWEQEQIMGMVRVICLEGVALEDNAALLEIAHSKKKRFKQYRIPVPMNDDGTVDEELLLFEYIASFVLSGMGDLLGFINHAMKVSGIDQERLSEAEAMFRTDVQGKGDNVG